MFCLTALLEHMTALLEYIVLNVGEYILERVL